jgi:hypothetical protein
MQHSSWRPMRPTKFPPHTLCTQCFQCRWRTNQRYTPFERGGYGEGEGRAAVNSTQRSAKTMVKRPCTRMTRFLSNNTQHYSCRTQWRRFLSRRPLRRRSRISSRGRWHRIQRHNSDNQMLRFHWLTFQQHRRCKKLMQWRCYETRQGTIRSKRASMKIKAIAVRRLPVEAS